MKRMISVGAAGAVAALTLGAGVGAAHAKDGFQCETSIEWRGDVKLTVIDHTVDTGIAVPAGSYSVEVAVYDTFPGRATAYEQQHEQVFVSVGGANTPLTIDLQDSVERADASFNLGELATDGGNLVIKHYFAQDPSIGLSTAHSIHVTSVTLVPRCEAPPTTPAPETTVPETTVPETTVPQTTMAPPTTPPATTAPATTTPQTTVPTTPAPTLPHTGPVQSGAPTLALLLLIGGVVTMSIVRLHGRRPEEA
jgi:hypothetical protein